MKKINFLFEIGTEEIPASYLQNAVEKLEESFKKDLSEYKLNFDKINLYSTPRRLAVKILGLQETQNDETIEKTGPAKKVAFDEEGKLTKAGLGFLKGANAKEEDVFTISTTKGDYLAVKIFTKGKPAKEILPVIMKSAIEKISFPKTMKWGEGKFMFARPIRWIASLINEDILEFEFNNIRSGNTSKGIRFEKFDNEITINNVGQYPEILKEIKVIADRNERKEIIRKQIEKLSTEDFIVSDDERLLEIVTDLVEYPTAVIAEFDKKYLELPSKIITSTLTQNQKYFSIVDKSGNLTNKFVFISNGNPAYSEIIKSGNEKVVKARLEDARFYYFEDTKKPLKDYVDKLNEVVFQAKLGTMYEKTTRIQNISHFIAQKIGLDESKIKLIEETALLSKADLVTLMLGEKEFTKLQGYIGMHYALKTGVDSNVAKAIYEHYMPRGQNDDLPSDITGAVVSIADKFDTVCGIISVDLIPTGSNDPFALRRAANGVVQIIEKYNFNISVSEILNLCFDNLKSKLDEPCHNYSIVKDFFKQRIKWLLEINSIEFDVIDALSIFDWDNINDIKNRAIDLQSFKKLPEFNLLVSGFKRVSNILEKNKTDIDVNEELFTEENEKALYLKLKEIENEISPLLKDMQYRKIMEIIVPIGQYIDAFFDKVLVMCDDDSQKNNRLALLKRIKDLFLKIADISKISYENQ